MSGFDLQKQDAKAQKEDEGAVVHIHGIDEKPLYYAKEDGGTEDTPVTITVAGVHSKRYRRAEEILRKRKIKPKQFTGEVIYEDNIEKVASCTIAWEGFFFGDEEYPLTSQNAKELYKMCPWVLDQVLEAMNDHARFFTTGSTTPPSTSGTE